MWSALYPIIEVNLFTIIFDVLAIFTARFGSRKGRLAAYPWLCFAFGVAFRLYTFTGTDPYFHNAGSVALFLAVSAVTLLLILRITARRGKEK